MMNRALVLGVIPARAQSSRFPFKVLAPILEKPMIQHVWEGASKASALGQLLVATDHERVRKAAEVFGARVIMTPSDLPSGSDRVAFVAKDLPGAEIIVNIQGDEPLLPPSAIDTLVHLLESDPDAGMATLAVKMPAGPGLFDRGVVKIAVAADDTALYFSREAIGVGLDGGFHKHLGIYAYRREVLFRFCSLPQGKLEQVEKLEQLRALENGIKIKVGWIDCDTIAVDEPGDISKVEERLGKGVS
jgi:3-deoxy-manno-octulosonate cytidylyltransferase (CMP-KDO synthetase)